MLFSRSVDTKPVLLAACSLVFLFRALAGGMGEEQNSLLQNQILRLIRDLVPARDGLLLVGAGADELRVRFREQSAATEPWFEQVLLKVCEEGAFEDAATGMHWRSAVCGWAAERRYPASRRRDRGAKAFLAPGRADGGRVACLCRVRGEPRSGGAESGKGAARRADGVADRYRREESLRCSA